jgi:DNA-binding transcriptional ArsR family regulator
MQSITIDVFRALASEKRLQILEWLKDPRAHFPAQVDGDLVTDGVCGLFIAQKLGVSQPTASVHLKIMTGAGLLTATKIRQWTFYRRNERALRAVRSVIAKSL